MNILYKTDRLNIGTPSPVVHGGNPAIPEINVVSDAVTSWNALECI